MKHPTRIPISVIALSIIFLLLSACSQYAQRDVQPKQDDNQNAISLIPNTTKDPGEIKEESENRIPKPAPRPSIQTVVIKDLGFEPNKVTLHPGESVLFNNTDFSSGRRHIIIGWEKNDRSFRFTSPKLDYGQSYRKTFAKKGVYEFIDAGLEDQNDREIFQGVIEVE